MKRFLSYLFSLTLLLCACTNDTNIVTPYDMTSSKSTEVYVNGSKLPQAMTRAGINYKDELGFSIPDDGKYSVFYFIRIDNNIPGEEDINLPSHEYFPRTKANKTMLCELNHGYVDANVLWKNNAAKGFSKYIYSTDGSAVESIIVNQPTLADLVNADEGVGDDFTGYLENADKLHIIWYICKKQDKDHVWHIDGVLTTKEKTDISETVYGDEITNNYKDMENNHGDVHVPVGVEVDIHQQEHKDWKETKTSVHVSKATDVTVELPIELPYICETDDFAIRTFEYKTIVKVNDTEVEWESVDVTVSHAADKTTISISGITQNVLDANDGIITVEVHSYYRDLTDESLWNKLKESNVSISATDIDIKGQIHSAFNDEVIELK